MANPWAIRCAAGPGVGWGHAVRCIALAQLAVEGGLPPPLLIGPVESRAAALAAEAGLTWRPLAGTPDEEAALASALPPGSWLVIDDYALDVSEVARRRRLLDCRVLVLDDRGTWDDSVTDAVLAVSAAAESRTYRRTRAFQGPRYLPLRRAVRVARPTGDRRGCLVALGGGATLSQLRSVLLALAPFAPLRVAPSASLAEDDMAGALEGVSNAQILPVGDLASQLAAAECCVCSGGLVKYEAAALGCLPIVVGGTETEAEDTEVLVARGLAVAATIEALPPSVRQSCTPLFLAEFRSRAAAAEIGAEATAVVGLLAS